ncbi:hypothetical protein COCNU_06G017490 [Cocos nucifera]|uniref:DNA polymerase kappa n=1 Tax=Cocos nucifera TaxID=13894 RepID=A0A8K0N3T8_COCNU|nr:hypothetical protein COCNU_06G017490 [Cocos nucifera]
MYKYNARLDGTPDYLSVGRSPVPSLFFFFALACIAFLAAWIYFCLVKNRLSSHWIHYLTAGLLFTKALNLLFATEDQHYVRVTGASVTLSSKRPPRACSLWGLGLLVLSSSMEAMASSTAARRRGAPNRRRQRNGMEGVDKEKVQRIIYEMSKGSKYFENEKPNNMGCGLVFAIVILDKVGTRTGLGIKMVNLDSRYFVRFCGNLAMIHFNHAAFQVANKKILELEASRDLSKVWLHTDMDAFYAAVETLENPSLKGKPMAVGSMSMICTANYEARKFGVRAAMPGFIAHKLCPDLVFVPTNFEKYTYYSESTRKVFRRYDPDFIATSLDEAYVNITEYCNERGLSSEEVAAELRNNVYEETGLTCSVGVAPNRLLAKIGGIGKVTETILKDVLGINTCEELLQKGAFLCALFSHCSTGWYRYASTSADGIENMGNEFSEKCDGVETKNEMISNFSGHKTVAASSQKIEPSWVDGYICSVCGIEMPPSFIEERQEHSDYHLAEMLQEEESVYGTGHLTRERSVRKAPQAKENARKKQKTSPKEGKHIPIDAFFIKGKKSL